MVVGSKRSPAMNPWKQNPDPFFSSKLQFSEVVQGAAQPSHDLAAQIPFKDFEVNAVGTLK